MCKSKAEGGKRCAAHPGRKSSARGGTVSVQQMGGVFPPMPADYQPKRSLVSRMLTPSLSESARRLFWYREECEFDGWIDRDGYPAGARERWDSA